MLIDDYISYIRNVRRYSPRTYSIYSDVINEFSKFIKDDKNPLTDEELLSRLTPDAIRNYEVELTDARGLNSRTVNLHLSALSSFCHYLLGQDKIRSNPVKLIKRPKMEKRLPVFYRKDAMDRYFSETGYFASEEALEEFKNLIAQETDGKSASKMLEEFYTKRLDRLIINIFYQTGIRRAELIGLRIRSIDRSRKVLIVLGKGDKMREIPLTVSLYKEILLYLNAAETMAGRVRTPDEPLLVSFGGKQLYPVYVDRTVKREFGQTDGITGRKSPHVLRHTLATELLDNGADMYSIKELLGHSSLAATQVYTHNSIEKLKNVYINAHPRAKRGGNNGD